MTPIFAVKNGMPAAVLPILQQSIVDKNHTKMPSICYPDEQRMFIRWLHPSRSLFDFESDASTTVRGLLLVLDGWLHSQVRSNFSPNK